MIRLKEVRIYRAILIILLIIIVIIPIYGLFINFHYLTTTYKKDWIIKEGFHTINENTILLDNEERGEIYFNSPDYDFPNRTIIINLTLGEWSDDFRFIIYKAIEISKFSAVFNPYIEGNSSMLPKCFELEDNNIYKI